MHKLQQRILILSRQTNLGKFTLREIGVWIGETSPQNVKHHLTQLEKRGLIKIDKIRGRIEPIRPGRISGFLTHGTLLSIPIVGSANAGPAAVYADENIEGYLRISTSLLRSRATGKLFALQVAGSSMNQASLNGKTINDGDYVIVDRDARDPREGDIIVSVIDGMANIKRFHHDIENHQIMLLSESTHNLPPIYIHEDDDYTINGKVVQVIKKPSPHKGELHGKRFQTTK